MQNPVIEHERHAVKRRYQPVGQQAQFGLIIADGLMVCQKGRYHDTSNQPVADS